MSFKTSTILKCKWVAQQTVQACRTGKVTVRSGYTIPVWLAFRCLFCGEYFDQVGAEEHFGQKRTEYNEKHPGVIRETEVIKINKIVGSTIR